MEKSEGEVSAMEEDRDREISNCAKGGLEGSILFRGYSWEIWKYTVCQIFICLSNFFETFEFELQKTIIIILA